jgi:hypothetical protein
VVVLLFLLYVFLEICLCLHRVSARIMDRV